MSLRWRAALLEAAQVAARVIRKSRDDRVNSLAAESAFFAVIAIFPALMIVVATLGWLDHIVGVDVARRAEAALIEVLQSVLTDRGAGVLASVHDLFARTRGRVVTSAALVAVVTIVRGFAVILGAVDRAYGPRESRSWIGREATAVLLSLGSALVSAFILAAAVAGPYLAAGRLIADPVVVGPAAAIVLRWLRFPVAAGVVVAWTATLYHFAHSRETRWRRDVPGALFASVLWLIVSYGFRLYLKSAANVNPVFGVLGGALTLMVWVYMLCLALLLGGELNAVLLKRARPEP